MDTSRCFMGRSRMAHLRRMLPSHTLVVGIDEHTGLLLDFETEQCHVVGKGGVSILGRGCEEVYKAGTAFAMGRLGRYHPAAEVPVYGPPVEAPAGKEGAEPQPPEEVLELARRREDLRQARKWPEADALRQRIAEMGFEVQDTKEGPRLRYKGAVSRER